MSKAVTERSCAHPMKALFHAGGQKTRPGPRVLVGLALKPAALASRFSKERRQAPSDVTEPKLKPSGFYCKPWFYTTKLLYCFLYGE